MKKLSFEKQIIVGMICVVLGYALSRATSNGIFENIGWILYGLLFALHPVWPSRANGHPRIKRYVQAAGAAIIVIGCMLRTGTDNHWQSRISGSLGIDTAKAAVVESYDDHGGFQGEGTTYVVLAFEDDELEQVISAPGGWHALPLTVNLQTLLYGTRTQTTATGPFVGVTVPQVKQGYWYFYDRQGRTNDDDEVLNRGSYNYTAAIYDSESNRLIYIEYDT